MQHRIVNIRKGREEFYNGNSWTRKYSGAKIYETLLAVMPIASRLRQNPKFKDVYITFR